MYNVKCSVQYACCKQCKSKQQKESEGLFQLRQQLETKTKTMNAMQCFTLSESLIWCKLNQHSLKAKQSGRQMS